VYLYNVFMDVNTPLIFTNGTDFYNNLSKNSIRHKKGLFILAPSGSGKTFYITRQKVNDWIDGDTLWSTANADLTNDEWENDMNIVMETNNRCDIITEQAKKQGFWVMGSSNNWLRPDAIVLPPWNIHKKYVTNRESNDYDGGAKNENLSELKAHRKIIKQWMKVGVPCFMSIAEAAHYLSK
jgi:hypothetical protein